MSGSFSSRFSYFVKKPYQSTVVAVSPSAGGNIFTATWQCRRLSCGQLNFAPSARAELVLDFVAA
jgi:hypothetical protein